MRPYSIDSRSIGTGDAAFVIAEVGINHCGDRERAIEMCRVAHECGADAVKFQTFSAEEFCGDPAQLFTYRSQGREVTESLLDMFERHELSKPDWIAIERACREIGITFFSTPQNVSDLELLLELDVPAIKIGSDDFTNLPLIEAYSRAGLPLILSSGMSNLAEVHSALDAAGWFEGGEVALLLCTSMYPTPPEEVHLARLTTLQNAFPGLVTGFSDHTIGSQAAAMATGLGAKIFEKHFTLDRGLPGPDHWFSESPEDLAAWIEAIRTAERIVGQPYVRAAAGENGMKTLARRSVVALFDIVEGEELGPHNIGARRPGGGLPPSFLSSITGLRALRSLPRGSVLSFGDFGR
ncbi:N-acetylneuraminate synthase family protein [Ciceribacter lividus]|nr:N-acetylneuraminate synthase family protein [Ciceribacter lividus]